MRGTPGQLCDWLGVSCHSVLRKGEAAFAGRPSFSERIQDRGRKEGPLKESCEDRFG